MKIDRYVAVEMKAFGKGMQKLFEGMAEVFSAIGAEEPDRLALEKAKWKKETQEMTPKTEATVETAVEPPASPEEPKDDPVSSSADENEGSTTDKGKDQPVADAPAAQEPSHGDEKSSTVTQDDIARIIVRKIKQDRSNNERIGQILKTYGVAKVSDLPETKYEAFLTDLAAI